MAKNMEPIAKRCKALGISPAVMGYAGKETNRNSSNMKRKRSEYALQLNEKQKVKFIYGILERQMRAYYEKALAAPGNTGENLLQLVERRLDNIVFRAGFASTRREARQLVTHGHFLVNGKRVDIPSYLCKAGETVSIKKSSLDSVKFKEILEKSVIAPAWMEVSADHEAKIVALPNREQIDIPVEEHLIVEFYSR